MGGSPLVQELYLKNTNFSFDCFPKTLIKITNFHKKFSHCILKVRSPCPQPACCVISSAISTTQVTIFVGYWGRGGGGMLPRTLTRPKESKFNYNKHKTFHGRMEGGGQPAGVITHRKRFGVVIPRKEKE